MPNDKEAAEESSTVSHVDDTERSKKLLQELIQVLDTELRCPICHEFLRDAININCSHVFCNRCFSSWLRTQNNICPSCRSRYNNKTNVRILNNIVNRFTQLLNIELPSPNIEENGLPTTTSTSTISTNRHRSPLSSNGSSATAGSCTQFRIVIDTDNSEDSDQGYSRLRTRPFTTSGASLHIEDDDQPYISVRTTRRNNNRRRYRRRGRRGKIAKRRTN